MKNVGRRKNRKAMLLVALVCALATEVGTVWLKQMPKLPFGHHLPGLVVATAETHVINPGDAVGDGVDTGAGFFERLTAHDEYLRLGFDAVERQASYRALFHSALTTDNLAAIRDCTHKGWALGSEQFRTQMEKLGKRQAASKGVGRPRKPVVPDNNRV